MEAPGNLFGQLRRGLKIDLGGIDIHMPHIGCQPRQPRVHILPVPVPGQQSVDRKGVSQVVDSGGGRFAVGDFALVQQPSKGLIDRAVVQAPGSQVQEQRRVRRVRLNTKAPVQIRLQRPAGGSAQGNPTGLAELAFGNEEPLFIAVKVFQIQSQGFPDPDAGAVEEPQERLVGMGPKRARRRQLRGGGQQRANIGLAIDVRSMRCLRGDCPYGLGYIGERIGSREVSAQLPHHTEAVIADSRRKLRKGLQIAVGDSPGQSRFFKFFFGQEAVKVAKQQRLTLIIGAGKLTYADKSLDLKRQATVKFQRCHRGASSGQSSATCCRLLKSTLV